ncbi:DUF481 domain-containing protein [Aequorivita sp. H23M31]|uniref:DUF481 domain-containing protein n=1 Tax=Aequorivita ciconiae TaxID=2494375 RepID=A0A410G679_9FLAO|nr:DUF481 domain-containing protein [Aequorivita sp. H23M31]QAA82777.1 DUF481 domain-containing protein [Aequorivita sp. H23M31]
MKHLALILFLSISFHTSAQVLNAESLRKVTDTSGFTGSASLDFSLKKDVNEYFGFRSNIHLQYKMKRNLILIKNDIEFQRIEGNKFSNSGISHIRYNYKIYPRITWEVFVQAQYNKVSKIDFRGLAGTGPRFKLSTSNLYNFYLGTLVMYEQEELDDGITPIQRDIRGSAYFSFSLYPVKNIAIISTTYYQPKLGDFEDYRVSSQSSLLIKMFGDLAFKTTYTFIFDRYPAVGIPKSQYNFSTGVAYSFD